MSKPRYPTRQEARSLLEKMRKISTGKIAGASLLALAALAPRCGGAAYNMQPYEQYELEGDKQQSPPDVNRAKPDSARPKAAVEVRLREASGADESSKDAAPDETKD